MNFLKKIIVTINVLKINIKKQTSFNKNCKRFFLIKIVDDVDVLFVLLCKKFELFFATFNVLLYFLNSI